MDHIAISCLDVYGKLCLFLTCMFLIKIFRAIHQPDVLSLNLNSVPLENPSPSPTCVQAHVHLEAAHGGEEGGADVAGVVALAPVGAPVCVQRGLDRERLLADLAREGPLARVDADVPRQIARLAEALGAHVAPVGVLPRWGPLPLPGLLRPHTVSLNTVEERDRRCAQKMPAWGRPSFWHHYYCGPHSPGATHNKHISCHLFGTNTQWLDLFAHLDTAHFSSSDHSVYNAISILQLGPLPQSHMTAKGAVAANKHSPIAHQPQCTVHQMLSALLGICFFSSTPSPFTK